VALYALDLGHLTVHYNSTSGLWKCDGKSYVDTDQLARHLRQRAHGSAFPAEVLKGGDGDALGAYFTANGYRVESMQPVPPVPPPVTPAPVQWPNPDSEHSAEKTQAAADLWELMYGDEDR